MRKSNKVLLIVIIVISLITMSGCTSSSSTLSVIDKDGAGSISFINKIPKVVLKSIHRTPEELVESLKEAKSIDSMEISLDNDSSDEENEVFKYTMSFDSIEEYNLQMSFLNEQTMLMLNMIYDKDYEGVFSFLYMMDFEKALNKDLEIQELNKDLEYMDALDDNFNISFYQFKTNFNEEYKDKKLAFEPAVIGNDETKDKASLIIPAYHSAIMYSWNALMLDMLALSKSDKSCLDVLSITEYSYNDCDMDKTEINNELAKKYNLDETLTKLSKEKLAGLSKEDIANLSSNGNNASNLSMSCYKTLVLLSDLIGDHAIHTLVQFENEFSNVKAPSTEVPISKEVVNREDVYELINMEGIKPSVKFNMTFGAEKLDNVDVSSYKDNYFVLSTTEEELEKSSLANKSNSKSDETPGTADNSKIYVVVAIAAVSLGALILSRKRIFG